MGKKKNKQKSKRKHYNKKEFRGIVCGQCCLCTSTDPKYCYEIAYKESPDVFMSNVFTGLVNYRGWLDKNNTSLYFIQINHFREIFCHSGICGKGNKTGCSKILDCFNAFKNQTLNITVTDRRKLRQEPVIFEAYPTFFISEDENFRKEIKEIFEDGNRDIKQDSGEGSTEPAVG